MVAVEALWGRGLLDGVECPSQPLVRWSSRGKLDERVALFRVGQETLLGDVSKNILRATTTIIHAR